MTISDPVVRNQDARIPNLFIRLAASMADICCSRYVCCCCSLFLHRLHLVCVSQQQSDNHNTPPPSPFHGRLLMHTSKYTRQRISDARKKVGECVLGYSPVNVHCTAYSTVHNMQHSYYAVYPSFYVIFASQPVPTMPFMPLFIYTICIM